MAMVMDTAMATVMAKDTDTAMATVTEPKRKKADFQEDIRKHKQNNN